MIRKPFRLALTLAAASLCLSPIACGGGGGDKKPEKAAKKPGDEKKPDAKDEKQAPKKGDYEGGAVDGGGKITGTITYTGDQKPGTVNVTKDEGTCVHGGKPDQDIVVADGKLANAVVWIDGIKKGKAHEPGATEVDNKECLFNPRVSIGHTGGEVAAKNSDAVLHNTHLYLKEGNKNLVNIALPQKDQVINKKLKKPGIVDIKCDAHEWMQGWMYVSEHPYATVTGPDGSFELGDVPAGDYKVKIWHEKLGDAEVSVKVEAGGDAKADHAFS